MSKYVLAKWRQAGGTEALVCLTAKALKREVRSVTMRARTALLAGSGEGVVALNDEVSEDAWAALADPQKVASLAVNPVEYILVAGTSDTDPHATESYLNLIFAMNPDYLPACGLPAADTWDAMERRYGVLSRFPHVAARWSRDEVSDYDAPYLCQAVEVYDSVYAAAAAVGAAGQQLAVIDLPRTFQMREATAMPRYRLLAKAAGMAVPDYLALHAVPFGPAYGAHLFPELLVVSSSEEELDEEEDAPMPEAVLPTPAAVARARAAWVALSAAAAAPAPSSLPASTAPSPVPVLPLVAPANQLEAMGHPVSPPRLSPDAFMERLAAAIPGCQLVAMADVPAMVGHPEEEEDDEEAGEEPVARALAYPSPAEAELGRPSPGWAPITAAGCGFGVGGNKVRVRDVALPVPPPYVSSAHRLRIARAHRGVPRSAVAPTFTSLLTPPTPDALAGMLGAVNTAAGAATAVPVPSAPAFSGRPEGAAVPAPVMEMDEEERSLPPVASGGTSVSLPSSFPVANLRMDVYPHPSSSADRPSYGYLNIDLSGPDGNAFSLMANAEAWAHDLGMDPAPILADMRAGDYNHLLEVIARRFGHFVTMRR